MDGAHSPNPNQHQPFQFSPILIGLIGIVVGAVLFAIYQCIVMKCSNRSGPVLNPIAFEREQEARRREQTRTTGRPVSSAGRGSDSMVVHVLQVVMPVFKYSDNNKECMKDKTCAVCLCEFSEGEDVRTLPQCMHSFHAPCVDMWLFSHSTCPLCRADTWPTGSLRHVVVPMPMPSSDEVPPSPEVQGSPEIGV